MEKCIDVAERTFADLPNEHIQMPPRPIIREPLHRAVWLFMAVYWQRRKILAVKTISEHQENQSKFGLPKAFGIIVLYQAENGVPLCAMDSVTITAMRTGAMTGVSVKFMARRDAPNVGLLGTGRLAEAQLLAITTLRKVTSVRVYSPTQANREAFAREMAEKLHLPVTPVASARAAVRDSDILVAATNSTTPVFEGAWVKTGTHIASLGTLPDRREVDAETIRRASIVVADLRENVLRDAGDIISAVSTGIIKERNVIEMSDIVLGKYPGRKTEDEITLFKSVGFAFLDLTTALRVYEEARSRGLGNDVAL